MIKVVDRVPTRPNRIQLTFDDGTVSYATWARADEPTEVGTPINAALFESILEDVGLTENLTVYVAEAGNDLLGKGTFAEPFATIQHAINSLPKNLNGHEAVINVAAGSYAEDVLIERFSGGVVIIDGIENAAVNIRSLRAFGGVEVQVRNIALSITGNIYGNAITVDGASLICLNDIGVSGSASVAVSVTRYGFIGIFGTLNSGGTTNSIIYASNCAAAYIADLRGDVSAGALIRSLSGSQVAYGSSSVVATVTSITATGGRIYSGAQSSIPNY